MELLYVVLYVLDVSTIVCVLQSCCCCCCCCCFFTIKMYNTHCCHCTSALFYHNNECCHHSFVLQFLITYILVTGNLTHTINLNRCAHIQLLYTHKCTHMHACAHTYCLVKLFQPVFVHTNSCLAALLLILACLQLQTCTLWYSSIHSSWVLVDQIGCVHTFNSGMLRFLFKVCSIIFFPLSSIIHVQLLSSLLSWQVPRTDLIS